MVETVVNGNVLVPPWEDTIQCHQIFVRNRDRSIAAVWSNLILHREELGMK